MDSTSYRRGLPTDKPTLHSVGEADNYHDRHSTAAAFTTKARMEDRNLGTPDTVGSCWKSPIPLGFQKSIWLFSTAQ